MARKFSPAGVNAPPGLQHPALVTWLARIATLAQPAQVYWVDGSPAEYDRLRAEMVESGMMRRLNPAKWPNSYLACSDASDVTRVGAPLTAGERDVRWPCNKTEKYIVHFWSGASISAAEFDVLTRLDQEAWQAEMKSRAGWFKSLKPRLPAALARIQETLEGEFE